jgi:glycosyltransferase involved in cell wall biosynthesis
MSKLIVAFWVRLSMKFSVLMSVYNRESPANLEVSLQSLASQTLPANEVLIVKDGPLADRLHQVIDKYSAKLPLTTLQFETNQGLGAALRAGMEKCRFDLVARMDSDDICVSERFERQIGFLEDHPEIDVLGSAISEFDTDPGQCISIRRLPVGHDAIRSFAKERNPLNHMTVVFRKSAVLSAGNYQTAIGFEDYDLWVRMLMRGMRFHNLPEPLVLVRCGKGMQSRRGGVDYMRREMALFSQFRRTEFLSSWEFLWIAARRLPVRLLPGPVRAHIYKGLLRQR